MFIVVIMYIIFLFLLLQMGFSSNLQGKAAHEALLCRQDAELRLLDTMRRCLANKVKCDREYAVAITSVALQGQKLERAEDLVGSLVAQASYLSVSPD